MTSRKACCPLASSCRCLAASWPELRVRSSLTGSGMLLIQRFTAKLSDQTKTGYVLLVGQQKTAATSCRLGLDPSAAHDRRTHPPSTYRRESHPFRSLAEPCLSRTLTGGR